MIFSYYFNGHAFSASMPGNFFACQKIHHRSAAVEMKLNFLSNLYCLRNITVSPPPETENARRLRPIRLGDGHAAFGILFLLDEAERTVQMIVRAAAIFYRTRGPFSGQHPEWRSSRHHCRCPTQNRSQITLCIRDFFSTGISFRIAVLDDFLTSMPFSHRIVFAPPPPSRNQSALF